MGNLSTCLCVAAMYFPIGFTIARTSLIVCRDDFLHAEEILYLLTALGLCYGKQDDRTSWRAQSCLFALKWRHV